VEDKWIRSGISELNNGSGVEKGLIICTHLFVFPIVPFVSAHILVNRAGIARFTDSNYFRRLS